MADGPNRCQAQHLAGIAGQDPDEEGIDAWVVDEAKGVHRRDASSDVACRQRLFDRGQRSRIAGVAERLEVQTGLTVGRLRIERLEEEKAGIAGDIKDVYAEAKGNGFDTKVLRKIIALRKRDYAERQEEEAILELYMQALGMVG